MQKLIGVTLGFRYGEKEISEAVETLIKAAKKDGAMSIVALPKPAGVRGCSHVHVDGHSVRFMESWDVTSNSVVARCDALIEV